jgi:1,5-anhydro-D-fructose reductase (1,5-anhydro-D-mannitol-forming)
MALGWAILGTGRFAGSRAAPALAKAQECRAAAVISRDRARAEEFAAEHGLPAAYETLEEALSDAEIEAVWVATPHALHRDHVLACARAGRHILCEKPLATSVADAQTMVTACEQAGVRLGTGFHLRHHPFHIEARRLVLDGSLGQVLTAEAEWSPTPRPESSSAHWRWDPEASGGGIFTGTGVHAVDLLRFVLGDEIESVAAISDRVPASGEVDRSVTCLLRFRGGCQAVVRCARGIRSPANELLLQGRDASVRVRHSLEEQTRGTIEAEGAATRVSGLPAGTDMYALQLDAFALAVREKRDPDASGVDGLRTTEVTLAVYEAAASGRTVKLDY